MGGASSQTDPSPDRRGWFRRHAPVVAASVVAGVITALLIWLGPLGWQWITAAANPPAPTCSDPRGLTAVDGVTAVPATPRPPLAGGDSFETAHLVDGDLTTAWIENEPEYGAGAQVTINFPRTVDLQLACVVNGWAFSESRFERNATVGTLEISTSAGAVTTDLPITASSEMRSFHDLGVPEGPADSATITIVSIHEPIGEIHDMDTAISEIIFYAAD